MDCEMLASRLMAGITGGCVALGTGVMQEGVKRLSKAVIDKIVAVLSPKLEAQHVTALEQCAHSPEILPALQQEKIRVSLWELLEENPPLAEEIVKILEDAGHKETHQTITQVGNGNRAVQISGSSNQVN